MYYQINIKETATNECVTYWTNVLNLDTFKEAKREVITRIKHGQTMFDRYLNNLFNN